MVEAPQFSSNSLEQANEITCSDGGQEPQHRHDGEEGGVAGGQRRLDRRLRGGLVAEGGGARGRPGQPAGADVVHDQLGHGEQDDDAGGHHRRRDANEEGGVVPAAHALVQPLAVVVEAIHALVARAAVLRARGGLRRNRHRTD